MIVLKMRVLGQKKQHWGGALNALSHPPSLFRVKGIKIDECLAVVPAMFDSFSKISDYSSIITILHSVRLKQAFGLKIILQLLCT